jgi:hypothetical protein
MGSKGCGENRKSLIALVRVHFRCGVNVDGADRQPSALGACPSIRWISLASEGRIRFCLGA